MKEGPAPRAGVSGPEAAHVGSGCVLRLVDAKQAARACPHSAVTSGHPAMNRRGPGTALPLGPAGKADEAAGGLGSGAQGFCGVRVRYIREGGVRCHLKWALGVLSVGPALRRRKWGPCVPAPRGWTLTTGWAAFQVGCGGSAVARGRSIPTARIQCRAPFRVRS